MAESTGIKSEARRLVDGLPDNATWDDLAYGVYLRQSIEAGRRDIAAGRFVKHEEVVERVRARIRNGS